MDVLKRDNSTELFFAVRMSGLHAALPGHFIPVKYTTNSFQFTKDWINIVFIKLKNTWAVGFLPDTGCSLCSANKTAKNVDLQ